MSSSIRKSVKISDDGFLKSTKDFLTSKKINLFDVMVSLTEGEQDDKLNKIRLGDLQKHISDKSKFDLPPEDAERLCQIAMEKCQVPDENDASSTWIDFSKLCDLITNA